MVMRKDELEGHLKDEHRLIESGVLKDDSPLDLSTGFVQLCDACRRGDLKSCQEMIVAGVNINARDQFDYTPLILVSISFREPT
jgi:ankyrin repeat/BTB/POZ domain-containing protein 1